MKRLFFIAVVMCCINTPTTAQPTPAELQKKLSGKKNLAAIMREVEKFYKEEEEENKRLNSNKNIEENEEEFESGLLHWKRWEYFNSTRLKPNGDIEDVNSKTITAWQKVNSKYGNGQAPGGLYSEFSGSNAAWSFIGPFNLQHQAGLYRGLCRIDKIVFHPTDPNIIYAGANNGGLWRTLDGGNTWLSMNFYFPIQSTSGIVINPNNPQNIFVLTGDGNGGGGLIQNSCGIWVTNDGGGNWFKTSFNSDPQSNIYNGFKLVMMPTLSYILFAATQNGLYRSTDSGLTWTLVLFGAQLTDFTSPIYDVEFDPAQPGRVYASGFGKFYLSENFGANGTFTQQTSIPNATRIEIGVSSNNFNYVYLLCGPFGPVGGNTFGGIYRSAMGGTVNSFTLRTAMPNILCWSTTGIRYGANDNDQSSYDLAIDVSPFNAEVVVTGGKNIWRSTTGGTGMQNLTVFNEDSGMAKFIHPDVHEITYNPLNGWLYAGTDGGIYRSTNNGVSWTNITNGVHTSTFYHMASAIWDVNRVLGGTQDNGVKYKSNAGDFTHITGADGFDCAFGPTIFSNIYTTVNNAASKFDINGANETDITLRDGTPQRNSLLSFFPVIACDPITNNTIYIAGGVSGVIKSINGGTNWTQVLNQNIQQSICTCPNNANRIYATGKTVIYRTDNGGTNWTGNLATNPGFINNNLITDINVCSANSDFVYVTLGGYTSSRKVMYSNDAGANWFNISGTLPAEIKINCVAVDQFNNAYIGTDMGVYYQAVSSNDWTPFFNQLPRVPITDLSINEGALKIRASTYGHGIWETALFTTCDINFSLTGGIAGEQFYQASNTISSTASIVGGNLTKVTARAGNEIDLFPDFTVYEGNIFNGILGACNSSPVFPLTNRSADVPPAFLSQVDKGNDSTLFKYGFININMLPKAITSITINAIQTGDFLIVITDKNGTEDLLKIQETIMAGTSIERSLATNSFLKGKYYIQLYYEGKLVHVQELIKD